MFDPLLSRFAAVSRPIVFYPLCHGLWEITFLFIREIRVVGNDATRNARKNLGLILLRILPRYSSPPLQIPRRLLKFMFYQITIDQSLILRSLFLHPFLFRYRSLLLSASVTRKKSQGLQQSLNLLIRNTSFAFFIWNLYDILFNDVKIINTTIIL